MTHSQLVASLVWAPSNPARPAESGIAEGNAYLVEPLGEGRYSYLARLRPDDWARLVEIAESER